MINHNGNAQHIKVQLLYTIKIAPHVSTAYVVCIAYDVVCTTYNGYSTALTQF